VNAAPAHATLGLLDAVGQRKLVWFLYPMVLVEFSFIPLLLSFSSFTYCAHGTNWLVTLPLVFLPLVYMKSVASSHWHAANDFYATVSHQKEKVGGSFNLVYPTY
jgi:hypothetical protein